MLATPISPYNCILLEQFVQGTGHILKTSSELVVF